MNKKKINKRKLLYISKLVTKKNFFVIRIILTKKFLLLCRMYLLFLINFLAH